MELKRKSQYVHLTDKSNVFGKTMLINVVLMRFRLHMCPISSETVCFGTIIRILYYFENMYYILSPTVLFRSIDLPIENSAALDKMSSLSRVSNYRCFHILYTIYLQSEYFGDVFYVRLN